MNNSLTEFFLDREIFVTGGSGFIGKGLIEKILRSFNVKKIFLLMREKKGISPEKRLEELKHDQIFDVLHREKPHEFDKLVPISGDLSQLNLALSTHSIEELRNVSIILHSAATIRFDEPLKTAILINVRGTRELLRIAEKLTNLQIFLSISTLFSNCNRKFIDEKIYPPPTDWNNCIRIAEQASEDEMRTLSIKFIQGYPNTYTFTKALSEHVVNDFQETLPIVIIRPSIVLCALFDPVPGYTDNLSGSTSIAVAGGTGLLRTLLCDPNMTPNQVSLDVVTRIAILSIWKAASMSRQKLPFICNISGEIFPDFSIRSQLEILETIWQDIPYGMMFWKPSVCTTSCEKYYIFRFVFTQLIPAIIGDAFLILLAKKPVLVKLQRMIFSAVKTFQFFLSNPFQSGFANMTMLIKESKKFPGFEAQEKFTLDALEYGKIVASSCRRFILKEQDSDLPKAKKVYRGFWFVDVSFKILLCLSFAWMVINLIFTSLFSVKNCK